jgi:hypothetical protein
VIRQINKAPTTIGTATLMITLRAVKPQTGAPVFLLLNQVNKKAKKKAATKVIKARINRSR